jgi:hypothetical protein
MRLVSILCFLTIVIDRPVDPLEDFALPVTARRFGLPDWDDITVYRLFSRAALVDRPIPLRWQQFCSSVIQRLSVDGLGVSIPLDGLPGRDRINCLSVWALCDSP